MARKLKPEDKHVTRRELLAELLILARASDASIAQLRDEMEARLGTHLGGHDFRYDPATPEKFKLRDAPPPESIPSPAEGPE